MKNYVQYKLRKEYFKNIKKRNDENNDLCMNNDLCIKSYVQKACLKGKIFNLLLKMSIELEFLMSSGKLFQRQGATREQTRQP